jgi:hypothetical protein
MTDNKKQKPKKSPMSRSNLRANELVINTLKCIQFYDWLTAYQIAKLILNSNTIEPVHQIKRILKRLVRDKYLDEYILQASGSKNIKAYKIRRSGIFLLKKSHSIVGISRVGITAKSHQYHRFIANETLIEFLAYNERDSDVFDLLCFGWLDGFSVDCVFPELRIATEKTAVNYQLGNLPDGAIKDNFKKHIILIEVENSVRNINNKNSKLRDWLDPFINVTMQYGDKTVSPDKADSDNDWASFSHSTQLFICSNDEIFRAIYRHVFRMVYINIQEDYDIYMGYTKLSTGQLTNDEIADAKARLKCIFSKLRNIEEKIFFIVLDGKRRWVEPFEGSKLRVLEDEDDYNFAFHRKNVLHTPDNIFDYKSYKIFGEILSTTGEKSDEQDKKNTIVKNGWASKFFSW